ncbi:MAG: ABC transporter ATP-binding protein, partial [Gammaproteobacteria bacterium]
FILDLDRECDPRPELDGFDVRQVDPLTLEVDLFKGQKVNTLFKLLSERNIQVRSMRNKSNRLEELFIRLLNEENN